MLRVLYANKPEVLCARLEEQLERDVGFPPRDMFRRTPLLAGSRWLAAWVRQRLALRAGIVANLDTVPIRGYLERLIQQAFDGAAVLDRQALRDLVLRRFLRADLGSDDLAPVRRYVDSGDQREQDLRRIQLASQVAGIFDEYLFSRPEMLDAWAAGRASHWEGTDDELVRWQRRLWSDLVGPAGEVDLRAEGGARYIAATRLLRENPGKLILEGGSVYVFGLPSMSVFVQELFKHVAQRSEVHLFVLNPCMEFWEDLDTSRAKAVPWRHRLPRRAAGDTASQFALPLEGGDVLDLTVGDDCRLLQAWGRPGRETIRLLNDATSGGTQGVFVDPANRQPTLLRRLQRDLLQRRPAAQVERVTAATERDGSIELLFAPSVRRECEAVAERIARLLEDPGLALDDVQVLIAGDGERYASALQAALAEGGSESALPYQLVGVPQALSNPVVEAARLLLELPVTRLTRADVLRVITHPVVVAGYEEGMAETWVAWIDELGVVHGADAEAHRGTYLEGLERLHWDQGLRRIGLGAFLSSRADGVEQFFEHGGIRDLPDAAGASLRDGGGALLLLARSLIADVQALKAASLSPAAWATTMATLFETYLHPRDDAERRTLESCLRVARDLGRRSLGPGALRYDVPRELLNEALAGVAPQGGNAITGGIRISTLQASRTVPARVTIVVGLSEGAFPSLDRGDPLDLRSRKRRVGDVRARERDCYSLLEALLCTNDRLIFTATDRNEVTGERRPVSPVVDDLLEVLEASYLPARSEEEPAFVHRVTLWRGDLREDGSREWLTPSRVALEESVLHAAGAARPPAREVSAAERVRDLVQEVEGGATLLPLLHLPPVPAPGPDRILEVRRVTFQQLSGFLRNPLHGAARVRLGLRSEGEADPADRTDEVFGLTPADRARLRRQVFLDGVRGHDREPPTEAEWVQAYRTRIEPLEAAGWAPLGILAGPEQASAVARFIQWEKQLRRLRMNQPPVLREVRFGPAAEGEHVDEARSPLVFEVPVGPTRTVRVELVGRTLPFLNGPVGVVLNAQDRPPAELSARLARGCDGWLNLVALAASRPNGSPASRVAIIGADRSTELHFRAMTQAAARAYLQTILWELLWGQNDLLFPMEPALEWVTRGGDSFANFALRALTGRNAFLYEGPVPHPESYPLPSDAEARELFARRFGLMREAVPDLSEAIGHVERAAREVPAPRKVPRLRGAGR